MTHTELDIPVRSETTALATQAGTINWRHLWGALSKPLRAVMVEHFLSAIPAERSRRRRWFAAGITAEGAGFTPASLMGRSDAEMAREASRIRRFRDDLVSAVVQAYFTEAFLEPQRALFGGAGIALNDAGMPEHTWGGASAEATARGVDAVLADGRDVSWVFLIAVSIGWPASWPGLIATLRRLGAEGATPSVPEADRSAEVPPAVPSEVATQGHARVPVQRLWPQPEPSLTILDDLLVKTILTTEAGHAHALTRDQLTHLLDEVVRMDTERRRTAYHLGFADGLFGEPWRDELRQQSEERHAWYAAGYLTARRRKSDPVSLLELWEHPSVRLLVGRLWPPLVSASGVVLDMLVAGGRDEDLARHAGALLDADPLGTLKATLTVGSQYLDDSQPDRAYSVLAPAADWVALREVGRAAQHAEGRRSERDIEILRVGHQVRRRFAHSCRLSGRRQEAEQELRALSRLEELEPETRAMLLADLGLLEAGYRRLADLTIPDQRSGFPDAVAQLGKGRAYFEQAKEISPTGAAHARYALGLLAALEGDWPAAATELHAALGAFESRPSVYAVKGLLARARGYEAIATIMSAENTESCRIAARRLKQALADGLAMPRDLTSEVALTLVTADAAIGAPFLEDLFQRKTLPADEMVSLLVDSPAEVRRTLVKICATLTEAETLSLGTRTRLAYKALEADDGSLPDWDRGNLRALIQDAACDGVYLEEFLAFVSEHRPAWGRWSRADATMAGAMVCLANGRLEEAQEFARRAFNRLLVHEDRTAEHDPEGALELLGMAGADPAEMVTLTQRLSNASPAQPEAPAITPMSRIHILIVGGDEARVRHEAAIQTEVAERYSGAVTVHMHPTGMGSNWNKHLEAVNRLLGSADGVLLSHIIRTTFGQRLRASLGSTPWRICTTHGRAGMLRVLDVLVRDIDAIRREKVQGNGE